MHFEQRDTLEKIAGKSKGIKRESCYQGFDKVALYAATNFICSVRTV